MASSSAKLRVCFAHKSQVFTNILSAHNSLAVHNACCLKCNKQSHRSASCFPPARRFSRSLNFPAACLRARPAHHKVKSARPAKWMFVRAKGTRAYMHVHSLTLQPPPTAPYLARPLILSLHTQTHKSTFFLLWNANWNFPTGRVPCSSKRHKILLYREEEA